MATLLIAEHDNASIKDSTNKALTAATALGGEVVGIGGIVREQHLLDAGELGRGVRRSLGIFAGHQHMDFGAEFERRSQRLRGSVLDRRVVVFGNEQCSHQITPASFLSFDTSSATSLTLTPPLRPGGSEVLRTSRWGVRSTP